MIKKKNASVFFALIFLAGLFVLVKINSQPVEYANKSYCKVENGQCQITNNGQSVALQITPKNIPLEEELALHFELPDELIIRQGWITGINMYMGKTPVIIQSVTGNLTKAVTFLGSCSEPNMQWLLSLEVENQQTNEQRSLYFRFITQNE